MGKSGSTIEYLQQEGTTAYVPAHAAAEFLIGTHPPVPGYFRERARRLYEAHIRPMVVAFGEQEAAQLAALAAELRTKGLTMKWFDAAIAATVLANNDGLWTLDSDYDRLKDRIRLLK